MRPREPDHERAEPEHQERRGHETQPRVSPRDDRREDVEVRVADGVARAPPLGPEPQHHERRDDEQAEQHPGALEAHRALEQSALSWTTARTSASSASPLTRTATRPEPTACVPDTPETRLALGGDAV